MWCLSAKVITNILKHKKLLLFRVHGVFYKFNKIIEMCSRRQWMAFLSFPSSFRMEFKWMINSCYTNNPRDIKFFFTNTPPHKSVWSGTVEWTTNLGSNSLSGFHLQRIRTFRKVSMEWVRWEVYLGRSQLKGGAFILIISNCKWKFCIFSFVWIVFRHFTI